MSTRGKKRGQEGGAGGHRVHEDVFVRRMSAVADGAEAVEGGHAQCGGEISVGTSTHGAFTEGKIHLRGE